jgi:hypothetical protein
VNEESPRLDAELGQMASNPRLARAIRNGLEKLSAGAAGPVMAEMANELLAGRTSLREIGRGSVYAGQLTEARGKFQEWSSKLTPEERDKLIADTGAVVADQGEGVADRP